uniref:Uncharacterized protein n=1 Tax=Aegilops tauschii TaxID=37682 RepID=M8BIY8_AEGTA
MAMQNLVAAPPTPSATVERNSKYLSVFRPPPHPRGHRGEELQVPLRLLPRRTRRHGPWFYLLVVLCFHLLLGQDRAKVQRSTASP